MTQEQALKILKTGESVFLTGEPGAGKTHTVNSFVAYLRSHGIEPAITASTGIAATHISGMTIHSWSGIGIKKELSAWDIKNILEKEYLVKRIKNTKVLIIDEISMLDAQTLSCVDRVCREIRGDFKPFGGIQVVLVGDFFQLPPVGRRGDEVQFAFESSAWRELNPTVCYLSEQHRQEDKNFLDLLSAIRVGNFGDDHFTHIEARMGQHDSMPEEITKLFSHNADVDRINSDKLKQIPAEEHAFEMTSVGKGSIVETLKKGCLSPENLVLKKGAVVMFTKNSPKGKFVNGTLGTVVGFDKETKFPIIKTKTGQLVDAELMEWAVEENGKVKAKIIQLPLRLAWAITIHKSQGMSLDSAVMDLGSAFEYGQGYVALSRVRSLAGLYLLGINETALLVHPEVLEKDVDFREGSAEAESQFEEYTDEELEQKWSQFILRSGGSLEKIEPAKPKEKVSTTEITLALLKGGASIKKVAKNRGLTEGTVVGHIESLKKEGKLSNEEIMQLLDSKLLKNLPEIHTAFKEIKDFKLGPVFGKLKGKYTYEQIRLARLVYGM